VSPTLTSETVLTLAAIYPTSPASNLSDGLYLPGSKYPQFCYYEFFIRSHK